MKKIIIVVLVGIAATACFSPKKVKQPKTEDLKARWVDSIYNGLSLEEKVGQLFMVAAYSNRGEAHQDSIRKLVRKDGIGGVIFFQGGPVRQAHLTNYYQSESKVPLLIGIDGEWGLQMRLDSTVRFPYNMTLGALKNDTLLYQIGSEIGKQCKRLGIHYNFAPVVDINTNANNPVIGVRSYGEDKINVTNKAMSFTEGMQDAGIYACAKHFPGHGDTSTDSHKALPVVGFTRERLEDIELYPYKKLIKKDIAGVMVAHLNVPALEPQGDLPSSLSYNIVTELLKKDLDYKGLIFTDALNMKGASNYKEPGDIDLAAFKAGNDVLLFTENAPKAISKIVEAYNNGEIDEERLSHSVKKILSSKFDVNLNHYKPINTTNLISDLNTPRSEKLNKMVFEQAVTLVKNQSDLLPIENSKTGKIGFLKLGDGEATPFLDRLKNGMNIIDITGLKKAEILKVAREFDKIIISYHRSNYRLTKAVSDADKDLIEAVAKNNKVILTVFASQYVMREVNLQPVKTVLVAYENREEAQEVAAGIVSGKTIAVGKLPASINSQLTIE